MNCLVIRSNNTEDAALAWVQTCASEVIEALDEKEIIYLDLLGPDAIAQKVNQFLTSVENHPTVIFGFGHGNPKTFLGNNSDRLFSCEVGSDHSLFSENFFYLHSCHCGKELGKKIVDQGGKGFLGYSDVFWFHPENILPFIRAANRGVISMIKNNCSLKESFDMTIIAYNEELEKAKQTKKFFVHKFLKKNRDILVKYGDDNFVMSSICKIDSQRSAQFQQVSGI